MGGLRQTLFLGYVSIYPPILKIKLNKPASTAKIRDFQKSISSTHPMGIKSSYGWMTDSHECDSRGYLASPRIPLFFLFIF